MQGTGVWQLDVQVGKVAFHITRSRSAYYAASSWRVSQNACGFFLRQETIRNLHRLADARLGLKQGAFSFEETMRQAVGGRMLGPALPNAANQARGQAHFFKSWRWWRRRASALDASASFSDLAASRRHCFAEIELSNGSGVPQQRGRSDAYLYPVNSAAFLTRTTTGRDGQAVTNLARLPGDLPSVCRGQVEVAARSAKM